MTWRPEQCLVQVLYAGGSIVIYAINCFFFFLIENVLTDHIPIYLQCDAANMTLLRWINDLKTMGVL